MQGIPITTSTTTGQTCKKSTAWKSSSERLWPGQTIPLHVCTSAFDNSHNFYHDQPQQQQQRQARTMVEDSRKRRRERCNTDERTCETASIGSSSSEDEDEMEFWKSEDPRPNSIWRLFNYCALIGVAALLWMGTGFYAIFLQEWKPNPVAECGDCHCAVSPGKQCPTWKPVAHYSDYTIDTLASQVAINPYQLWCNPYQDDDCETSPPQIMTELGEAAVCAVHYDDLDQYSGDPVGAHYMLQTHASALAATLAGGIITHYGACGVCSSTQDLAAYLRHVDLATSGRRCSVHGILSFDLGVQCYRDLGFTESCAEMWIFNGYNTRDSCLAECLWDTFTPNNSNEPGCPLNSCLQCDEDHSGPLFKRIAARTRRRSGILSAISRSCDALHQITHVAFPGV